MHMPSTEKLKKYPEQFSPIPDADWAVFSSRLQYRVFARKQQILRPGEIEHFVSFIEKGIVRYYVEEGDKDIYGALVMPIFSRSMRRVKLAAGSGGAAIYPTG